MIKINQPPPSGPPAPGLVISRPRATDAIGAALGSAFAAQRSLSLSLSLSPELAEIMGRLDIL